MVSIRENLSAIPKQDDVYTQEYYNALAVHLRDVFLFSQAEIEANLGTGPNGRTGSQIEADLASWFFTLGPYSPPGNGNGS